MCPISPAPWLKPEWTCPFIHCILNTTGNALDHFIRATLGFGADLGAAQALELGREDAGQNLRSAEVHSNDVLLFSRRFGHRLKNASAPRQHVLDLPAQFHIDIFNRTLPVDNRETVSGLNPFELGMH